MFCLCLSRYFYRSTYQYFLRLLRISKTHSEYLETPYSPPVHKLSTGCINPPFPLGVLVFHRNLKVLLMSRDASGPGAGASTFFIVCQ